MSRNPDFENLTTDEGRIEDYALEKQQILFMSGGHTQIR
jgi:hypothetical protein